MSTGKIRVQLQDFLFKTKPAAGVAMQEWATAAHGEARYWAQVEPCALTAALSSMSQTSLTASGTLGPDRACSRLTGGVKSGLRGREAPSVAGGGSHHSEHADTCGECRCIDQCALPMGAEPVSIDTTRRWDIAQQVG